MIYKYIGKTNFFIKNGDIVNGELTTWSVKDGNVRKQVRILYIDGAGFKGESMPISELDLIQIEKL